MVISMCALAQADGVGALSQSLQEVAIEGTNTVVLCIDQVNDCSEGCARPIIDNLEVSGPNNGSVEKVSIEFICMHYPTSVPNAC